MDALTYERCQDPNENWLCLCCKDVPCSRFVTSICCSIFNSQIIAWHSATGIHITISIIFFKLSSLIFSAMFYKAVLVMFCLLLETVISQFGVSPAMPIWMLKWLCNCNLFMRQPTFWNLVRLHHFTQSNN